MNHDPYFWGRPSDSMYGQYNHQIANAPTSLEKNMSSGTNQHTTSPIVTGTSVVAIKYNNGVVMAADNLASYGSLLRFPGIERLHKVGNNTMVGISGDVSDMQYLLEILDELSVEHNYDNDEYSDNVDQLEPDYIFTYLANLMYHRRSKMNPLWNALIVAGVNSKTGEPFLQYVNLLGVKYSSPSIATGFGAHLAIPLLRKLADSEEEAQTLTKEQAVKGIKDSMKVLFYRDTRSSKNYSLAIIDKDSGITYDNDVNVEDMSWKFAKDIKGYGTQKV
ncbi:probable Proteasome subunit beta type-7 [Hanseniaspora guilliermondii]|uniref:Proteasome subunit beta n=1 Tax=Hanseniaspora guilliermondii TaxID=56406 RepID=A0A1L0AZ97_9ASCO|nr:probable Proteasome subunit beta type-7 [Hanseniaspora guilliermondii]